MVLGIMQELLLNDFTPILSTQAAKTGELGIFCAGKQAGPNLYCVIAVDARRPAYKQEFEHWAGYLGASHSMNDYNVVILGVFDTDEVSDELKEYATATVESFEKINIIKWVLTPNGVEVYGRQPDRLLNIRTLLEKSLTEDMSGKTVADVTAYGHEKRRERIVSGNTFLTYIMIGVLIFIYILQIFDKNDTLIYDYAALPLGKGEFYRNFTCMFLHGSVEHLLSNLLALYIFGTRVERYYGKKMFALIYFIGGVLASLTSSVFLSGMALGASGAIFALMGAVLMYSLRTKRSIDGFDLYFLIFFVLVGLAGGGLVAGIDNIAHIAGFVYGCVISMFYGIKGE